MFGSIGGAELLLVLVLALLLFGPRKLPQIGRKLGDALAQFRKATHDFKNTLESEVEMEEVRQARAELTSAIDDVRLPGVARGSLDTAPAASATDAPAGETGSAGGPAAAANDAEAKPSSGPVSPISPDTDEGRQD